ncbi:MAG: hypothetical protein NWP80_01475 [Candidatus Gracilibacteria bacterium]|nr:hypothetical protein [Candidatus Gracilibacteria bacterium]
MSRIENKRMQSIGDEIEQMNYEEILFENATDREIESIRDKLNDII